MTELRDARLRRALQAADESPHGPQLRTREAVLRAAREAAAPATPWWKRLGASRPGLPWNAAFATLAVAVLVTLMWEGREVPGAKPEQAAADIQAPVPAPAPAPSASAPAAVQASPAPAAAKEKARAPQAAEVQGPPAGTRALAREDAGAVASERKQAAAPEAPSRREEASRPASAATPPGPAQGPTGMVHAPAAAPAPAPPPAPATREARELAENAVRDSALAKSAPAAPARAAQAPAGTTASALAAQALPWEAWTELRIASGGREVVLSRRRAETLAELLNRAARLAQSGAAGPSAGPRSPVASFELSTRGTLLGVVELNADQTVLFLPVGESGPSRTVRLDPADAQALWEEAQRLLAR